MKTKIDSIEISLKYYESICKHGDLKLPDYLINTDHTVTLTCGTNEPINAFCWMGYNLGEQRSSNLKKINKVICSVCGKTKVLCSANINPNTYEFHGFIEESFYNGYCNHCGQERILTSPEDTINELYKRQNEFDSSHNEAPRFAICDIVTYTGKHLINQKIGVESLNDEFVPHECYWVCENLKELESLCSKNEHRFIIIRCSCFQ